MKYIFLTLLISFLSISLTAQSSFEKSSQKIKIDIKVPPPDSIKPVINISRPLKKPGYPVYSRDSVYTISGTLTDNSGKATLLINSFKIIIPNGGFKQDLILKPGLNIIPVKAFDKRMNETRDSISVIYDPLADINPPTLKITEPRLVEYRGIKTVPKFSDADSNLYVKGKVLDEGSILGVWINDEQVEINENSEFTFYLFNRYDSIIVEAADMNGNLTVEKFFISSADVGNIPDTIKYHALIIAVEDYRDTRIDKLDFPVKDAAALAEVLSSFYLFDKENIILLENPDRHSILEQFHKLRKLTHNDNLLIFYAGHGSYDESNQQGYWIPVDGAYNISTNWISNDDVRDYIRSIKTKHTLVIADACFAGSLSRELNLSDPELLEFEENYKYQSRRILASGPASKKVPDKSVFFKFLVRKLSENQKKILTGKELAKILKDPVMNNSPDNQIPAYHVIQSTGDDGPGDFIFIRR